jgi:hypothetical protein
MLRTFEWEPFGPFVLHGGVMAASDHTSNGAERRRAPRMPVRGVAVFYGEDGAICGTIENLSKSGALVQVAAAHATAGSDRSLIDVELKLGIDTGWVAARAVRIAHPARGAWQIAVEFDQIDHALRAAIESAIAAAVRAAKRRPILVIDGRAARRRDLVAKLSARGMSPLAPTTPLEAVDLLARPQLHVGVCLVAPSFGHSADELRAQLVQSFPWLTIEPIVDDLDDTISRAQDAWAATAVARLAGALS